MDRGLAISKLFAFFNKLGKYISQGKSEQLAGFSRQLSAIAAQLEAVNITEKITVFFRIVDELNHKRLLLRE